MLFWNNNIAKFIATVQKVYDNNSNTLQRHERVWKGW